MPTAENEELRCEECDEKFDSESELLDHNKTVHQGRQQSSSRKRKTA